MLCGNASTPRRAARRRRRSDRGVMGEADIDTQQLTDLGILVLRKVCADSRRAVLPLEAAGVSPEATDKLQQAYADCARELELLIVDTHHLGDPVAH